MVLAIFIFGLNCLIKDMFWASSAVPFQQSQSVSLITQDTGSPYEGRSTRDLTPVRRIAIDMAPFLMIFFPVTF